MPSFALVTKTYHGDMQPFTDLCKSIDHLMPDIQHYVLIDHADKEAFASFAGPKRTIVDCSQLLPELREMHLLGRRFWRLGFTRIIRGWIYQQIAKIAFVANMEEDAAVHLDSDVTLLKAIKAEHVFPNGNVRLYHQPGGGMGPRHLEWHNLSQKMLGLPQTGYVGTDYIGPITTWSPGVIRAMIDRIEASNRRDWIHVLASHFRFSEYIIYGIFCDHVAGKHQQLIAQSGTQYCHNCWGYDLRSKSEVERFIDDLQADHLGVLIQSNLQLPERTRLSILHRTKEQASLLEAKL